MNINEINELLENRLILLENDYEGKLADIIEENIRKAILNNFDNYPIDFIIETLTKFGEAPSIVYDDNGLFAVSSDGYNPVVTGKEKIVGPMTIFVEKKMWKKTIREALLYYLKH